MKLLTRHVLALALAFAFVNSQQLPSGLPACAEPVLFAAIQASGCNPTDAPCICSNPKLIPGLMHSIADACSPADQAAVQAFAATYCGAGVASSVEASTTEVAIASTTATDVASTEATLTVASAPTTSSADLPEAIGPPATTNSPTDIVADTSSFESTATAMATATASMTTSNFTGTMTYSTTATATPINGTMVGGASQISGFSIGALAAAMAGMTWVSEQF